MHKKFNIPYLKSHNNVSLKRLEPNFASNVELRETWVRTCTCTKHEALKAL